MKADTYPLQVLLWTFSGWLNRHQQDVIAYLVEENRVLKEQMKGRRLRLTDEQRRRLAAKGKPSYPKIRPSCNPLWGFDLRARTMAA